MTFDIFFTSVLILVAIFWGAYLYNLKEVIYRQYGEEGMGGVLIKASRRRAFQYRRQIIFIWILFVTNVALQSYVDFGELMGAPYLDFARLVFIGATPIQLILLVIIVMKTRRMSKEDELWKSL